MRIDIGENKETKDAFKFIGFKPKILKKNTFRQASKKALKLFFGGNLTAHPLVVRTLSKIEQGS